MCSRFTSTTTFSRRKLISDRCILAGLGGQLALKILWRADFDRIG
jgi:hypothetical protein